MEFMEFLEPLYETFELLIKRYGALGIGVAMFAESAGVPFASSVVFLTAGTLILRGTCTFWSIFISSTIGITLGSMLSYSLGLLGSMVGNAVKLRFFHLDHSVNNLSCEQQFSRGPSKLLKLWHKYGNFSIFMGQLWGFSRTFISFPAGAMHMNFYLFLIYTFLGGALFSLLTIGASLILTGTMSFMLRALKTMFDFSPWLLFIPAGLVAIFIYYYRHRGWKIKYHSFSSFWGRFKNVLKGIIYKNQ